MKLRTIRLRNWFPIILTIMGSLALITGVYVAVFSVIVPVRDQHSLNLPLHGAVYVGEKTCYTCHRDESPDWSLTLYTQTIVNSVVKPIVVADFNRQQEVEQIDVGDMSNAYTTGNSSTAVGAAGNSSPQHYIVKTDAGHALLPGQWDADSMLMDPADLPVKCLGCHTTNANQNQQPIWYILIPEAQLKIVSRFYKADTRQALL